MFVFYSVPDKYLLFASRGSIRYISMATKDLTDVYLPIDDLHNVIAIDFDLRSKKMYYSDVYSDVIRYSVTILLLGLV